MSSKTFQFNKVFIYQRHNFSCEIFGTKFLFIFYHRIRLPKRSLEFFPFRTSIPTVAQGKLVSSVAHPTCKIKLSCPESVRLKRIKFSASGVRQNQHLTVIFDAERQLEQEIASLKQLDYHSTTPPHNYRSVAIINFRSFPDKVTQISDAPTQYLRTIILHQLLRNWFHYGCNRDNQDRRLCTRQHVFRK